jgi:hypothetical protein
MGSIVQAECDCGFTACVFIGGGFLDYKTTRYFPCLCSNCGRLVQVNVLAPAPSCPDCGGPDPVPYDDPQLVGARGQHLVAECNLRNYTLPTVDQAVDLGRGKHRLYPLRRNLALYDGSYLCPGCSRMTLRFTLAGMWD